LLSIVLLLGLLDTKAELFFHYCMSAVFANMFMIKEIIYNQWAPETCPA